MTVTTEASSDGGRPLSVTKPGVYDMAPEVYHADPCPAESLSSSLVRRLLATCPERFRYELDTGMHKRTPEMDLGSAAHKLVLGSGPELVKVEADTYRTKKAQQKRDQAYAEGAIPLKSADYDVVEAMAEKLREHDLASVLLGGAGKAEQALFWKDGPSGVWRRALLDFLPDVEPGSRMYLADYKTAKSASRESISKQMFELGYHLQGAWYVDAVKALGLAEDIRFYLVVQEKTAPYLVSVVEVKPLALDAGRHENRKAIDLYTKCRRENHWPPYIEGLEQVGLPSWAEARFLAEVTGS
ncbi:PD-(D/E)XK nuclease-like domain-containing protein [Actinomadura opuntiae]|uniref:PD-(D/E)XK nuclease-like domain-containing protein n=1 Tax=Actinomadura sp. OS1-43 TaxID=604315 RepID=UPI00255A9166|nr:PD-(D/E)XK nuclease-like domain-containing protein [Actinomadura sp. OS1-43]MDL4812729.1 PD-(D/E)XK nuclease-like domain-containing protein [Actinomadura sp. OS1-43]